MNNRAFLIQSQIHELFERKPLMLTVSDLRKSVAHLKNYKQGEQRHVSIISLDPIIQNKTLTIKAEAHGTKLYPMVLTFYNVDYDFTLNKEHPLTVRTKTGERIFMEPASESRNPIQCRCQCKDFELRFSVWDKKAKALTGASFPTYIRKTTTRPEINPDHFPGICKHIISLLDRLSHDKILTG